MPPRPAGTTPPAGGEPAPASGRPVPKRRPSPGGRLPQAAPAETSAAGGFVWVLGVGALPLPPGPEPFFSDAEPDPQEALPTRPGVVDASRGLMAVLVLAAAAAGWVYGAGATGPLPGGSEAATGGQAVHPKAPAAAMRADMWPGGGPLPRGLQTGPRGRMLADTEPPPTDPEAPQAPRGAGGSGPDRALAADSEEENAVSRRPPFVEHRVAAGETLWDIARAYGTDVESIYRSNPLYRADLIQPGQVLTVPTVKGVVHRVQRGETLWDISRQYGVSVQSIVLTNGLASPEQLRSGQLLVIPGVDGPRQERLVVGGRLQRAFRWPVRGPISSPFGWRWGRLHEGVDIAVARGTPVRAAAPGRVVYARWGGGYGYLVEVDHGSGVTTRYAHNSRIVVREGQYVGRGQVLAFSGGTGHSTGPHLHFEIRYRGRAVDPLPFLR